MNIDVVPVQASPAIVKKLLAARRQPSANSRAIDCAAATGGIDRPPSTHQRQRIDAPLTGFPRARGPRLFATNAVHHGLYADAISSCRHRERPDYYND